MHDPNCQVQKAKENFNKLPCHPPSLKRRDLQQHQQVTQMAVGQLIEAPPHPIHSKRGPHTLGSTKWILPTNSSSKGSKNDKSGKVGTTHKAQPAPKRGGRLRLEERGVGL